MNEQRIARELVAVARGLIGARSRQATLKSDLERAMKKLIKKHNLTIYGEPLYGDIYRLKYRPDRKTVDVIFNDENMMYLLAGHVASSVYDEMERIFKSLGYEGVDSDGNRLILMKIGA